MPQILNGKKNSDVKNLKLSDEGKRKIAWAGRDMPVLGLIAERFSREKPLRGYRVSACLHVTSETANLMITLKKGGADVALCASNPLSTQDDVAASLVRDYGIKVFAVKGEDNKTYYSHIQSAIAHNPHITMDDGADVISTIHKSWGSLRNNAILGGTEETTTGVIRLKAMEKDGALKYPVIAVNDSMTKHMFDNRYGTGQSTLDGIMRATNALFAGRTVVAAGYGWCGRGVASRARGLGAEVIVTEVDEVKALEAAMDGFRVMPMSEAAGIGDIFITLTGDINVLDASHFRLMKDGAIVSNSGHFNVEINIPALRKMSKKAREIRPFVKEYVKADGRKVYLLADGRLINLAAAEGHPASVMDMSFANQSLAGEYMIRNHKNLENRVYTLPEAIDRNIASLKLKAMGIKKDNLTPEQKKYLASWQEGT
ncbi:MAG: adenosylhomocysteinase [Elusimicrobia bacterium CG08_land_8_20_14_0_20_51_18]|nr:MAG: adenosylhomocysteinase [Elusimicrobia bacterium CG08_land_8_20_14_0_20_51_18]